MPIDPSKVVWDAPDPAKVKWDDEPKAPEKGPRQRTMDQLGGLLRGAGSIGSTLIELARTGPRGEPIGTFLDRYKSRTSDMDQALATLGADTQSGGYKGFKLGTEVAGSLGAGQAVGRVAGGLGLPLAESIASSGMTGGVLQRLAGGAVAGGAAAGLVNPEEAKTGAIVGGFVPGAMQTAGELGKVLGRSVSGAQTPEVAASVKAARDLGYVIPPTQAKPSLGNRLLEGLSGKISTAQNASARNAGVTNELARKAIGASELSDEGLSAVRAEANKAYDALASVGEFKVDDAFRAGLSKIQPQTIPGTKNADVSGLVETLSIQQKFDAQATINTVKQLRFDGFANKIAPDPTKRALGQAQLKAAGELEGLIERNLKASGQDGLLDAFKQARQVLAKTHTVEKALNKASGNVDASVLRRELEKGKPLSGELKSIAEFAQRFPKAAQSVEKMGSLPQTSPLDWAAVGSLAALMGEPTAMLGVAARPLARSAALSPMVQDRLIQEAGPGLLSSPEMQLLLARSAPALLSGR